MDINDVNTNKMPAPSSEEKRKMNPWDVETTDLPTVPLGVYPGYYCPPPEHNPQCRCNPGAARRADRRAWAS